MAPGAERRSLPLRRDRDEAGAVGSSHGVRAGSGSLDEVGARRSRRAPRPRDRIRGVSSRAPTRSRLVPGVTRGGSRTGADTVPPGMGRAIQRAVVVAVAIPIVGWLAISYG